MTTTRILRPTLALLPGNQAALERGWSPDNTRPDTAPREALERIASDVTTYLSVTHDPEGQGPPVTLPDGTQRARIPGIVRWIWDSDDGPDGFAGSIGLRWMPGHAPLPPHVLGHIGYAVVPWKQKQGHASRALALMLAEARTFGLPRVEITTDVDNEPSQKVITNNGGVLLEHFDKGVPYGHKPGLRYVIELA